MIKAQHAAGKRYGGNVTEPDVHISGNTAWIAYVNQGSITDASGTVSQKWLESAFLQKQAGIWKIVFMDIMTVPLPPPQSPRKKNDGTPNLTWVNNKGDCSRCVPFKLGVCKEVPALTAIPTILL